MRLGRRPRLRLGLGLGDLGQRRISCLGVGFRGGELVLQLGGGRVLDRLVDRLGRRRHAEHRAKDVADGAADHAAERPAQRRADGGRAQLDQRPGEVLPVHA
ncbi:MAG: hypothetical protein WAL02_09475 [Rhodoplanes sp.]